VLNKVCTCKICGTKREVPKMRWAKYCHECAKKVKADQTRKLTKIWHEKNKVKRQLRSAEKQLKYYQERVKLLRGMV